MYGIILRNMEPVQTDKKTERARPAIFSPYIRTGTLSLLDLTNLVEEMKKHGAVKAKVTGEMIFVWEGVDLPSGVKESGKYQENTLKASNVRPVKTCSAQIFCQRYQQPMLELAYEIDARFKGQPLPRKLVIGTAGCQRSCSEPATKDIGIIGTPKGYEVLAGGAAGLEPMIGKSLGIVKNHGDVIKVIDRIIVFMREHGKNQRLGRIMQNTGIEEFKTSVGIAPLFIGKNQND
jgi:NAD(P)H-nitrite reductase large subunit